MMPSLIKAIDVETDGPEFESWYSYISVEWHGAIHLISQSTSVQIWNG